MMTAPDASSYSHVYRLFEFFDKDVEALMLTSNEVTLGNRAAGLQATELAASCLCLNTSGRHK